MNCHISMVEFEINERKYVALYDKRDLSYDDVIKYISAGEPYHPNMIVMTQNQYDNVFKSLKGAVSYED